MNKQTFYKVKAIIQEEQKQAEECGEAVAYSYLAQALEKVEDLYHENN